MAETVYLLDGSTEIIFDEKPVFMQRLIRDKLGTDAENCFLDCISEMQEENKYLKDEAEEHEGIADSYHAICNDALEIFETLKSLLSADRLDRQKLSAVVEKGYTQLHNNL